jgi:hypothetical protein
MINRKLLNKNTNKIETHWWSKESDIIIKPYFIEIPNDNNIYKWENNQVVLVGANPYIKIQQDINTLLVEYNKFTLGVQRQFNDLKNYVIADMGNNNYTDALETIQTWVLPLELEPFRQQFIDLFNSLNQ